MNSKNDPNTFFDDVIDPDDPSLDIYKDIEEKVSFEITPVNIRRHFLHKAAPLIDTYIDVALGKKVPETTNLQMQNQVWEVLREIILSASDHAPVIDLKGKTVDEQVSKILELVSTGGIPIDQGKEYLSLVQQGFELTELPDIIAKMEALENLGVV